MLTTQNGFRIKSGMTKPIVAFFPKPMPACVGMRHAYPFTPCRPPYIGVGSSGNNACEIYLIISKNLPVLVVKLSEKLLKKWGFMNDRYYFLIKKYNHYSMKWLFLLGFHLSPYKVGTPLAVCHPDKAKPDVSQ
jgi:hypothetical protein